MLTGNVCYVGFAVSKLLYIKGLQHSGTSLRPYLDHVHNIFFETATVKIINLS